jgi:hypothetical protein
MRSLPASALAVSFVLAACGPATTGPTWYQDVQPIVQGRCVNCHKAGGVAPFSMESYAEARPYGSSMAIAVNSGRMPPWKAGAADVTYLRDPTLTDAEKKLFADWAQHGMPEGDAKKPGTPLPQLSEGLDHVDARVTMSAPYTPSLKPDDYRCFPMKWTETTQKYIVGMNAVPGVPAMAHHIALYLVPPDSADLPFQWDAEDATPGYSCFGGPFGSRPQTFAVNLLAAWIPGTKGVMLERGGGIAVPPGATLVMQMHYNVQNTEPQPDTTEMQFALADTVTRKMAYQPYLDPGWVAGGMRIPAGATNVQFTDESDPRDFFKLLGSPLDNTNGFNIEAVMFHMHKLGKIGQLYLVKGADHSVRKLLDIQDWDFHWQLEYHLTEPVRFEPGDKLRVRCVFDNSPGRLDSSGTTKDVNWGEGSDDEMCVANILSSE